MHHYLAFDLGAESGRAVSGTLEGGRISLEEVHRFPNQPVFLRGALTWDFPGLMREMQTGLGKFVRRRGESPAGISCDSWGVDFGLLDREGNPLASPIHYRDKRTEGMPEQVFSRVSKEEIYSRTGIQFMPINTLYQLEALHSRGSLQWAATDKFLMMADLVNHHFCGAEVVESSLASTSNLFAAKERVWAEDLIDRLGYPRSRFPEIVPSGTRIGTLDDSLVDHLGLPADCRNTPVIASLSHDTAAAVAAIPSDPKRNWAYLSSGTWSLLGVELPEPILTQEAMRLNFTNEAGAEGTIRFLKNIMGLWILQECRRTWETLGTVLDYSELATLAAEAPSGSAFIDPDDPRFLPPGDMPGRIRDFCLETGQTPPKDVGSTTLCVFESLALKYRAVLESIETLTGSAVEVLHLVGGGGKNRFLNQLVADILGIPLLVGPTEATAIGNILAQAMAMNEIGSLEEGRRMVARSFEIEVYEPSPKRDWGESYRSFKGLLAR
ncbi:MAG: rhamnulokinase [Candidatus Omnitrophica bacterium]|nr:L-Rhamnulokinase [bacterium]NUN94718.1 rhamnulokinase [Candidatus Omnitrophota bacterium]